MRDHSGIVASFNITFRGIGGMPNNIRRMLYDPFSMHLDNILCCLPPIHHRHVAIHNHAAYWTFILIAV